MWERVSPEAHGEDGEAPLLRQMPCGGIKGEERQQASASRLRGDIERTLTMSAENYLTVNELKAKLGISRASLYRLMAKGLPFVTVGHHRRFLVRQVESWVRKDVLTPGDYRCAVCQWTGHIEQRRYRYGVHCPNCLTVVPPMQCVQGETA